MAWTNKGKEQMFESWFSASAGPSSMVLMASTSATGGLPGGTWNADLSSTSQVTLVTAGFGYASSGIGEVLRNGVDFTVSSDWTVGTATDWAQANLRSGYQLSADGGTISDVHYILLADGEETDETARNIYAYWSTGTNLSIAAGNTVSISTAALRAT